MPTPARPITPEAAPATPSEAAIIARLEQLPASPALWRMVALISLGCVFEFYDLFLTAYVAPGMSASGMFEPASLGPLATLRVIRVAGVGSFVFATFAGLWLGVLLLGHAADRYGRRSTFLGSLLCYCLCTFVMAWQRSGLWLDLWRFAAGIGFGVQLITVDALLAELVPRQLRGRAFALNQCISFAVVPFLALCGWLLVPHAPFGVAGWRWVMLIGSSGALGVWALRRTLPESPRWLASRGRLAEADVELRRIEARLGAPAVAPPPTALHAAPSSGGGALFSARYRRRTLMLSVFNVAQVIGFYGFNSWMPTLLVARGITVTHSLQYAFFIALAQPAGPLLGWLFADRIERKSQIIAGLAGMGAAMGLFALASTPAALIVIGILFTLCANVMSFAFHGYQSELYPTQIRSRAVGFVYSWSRLAAALSGLVIGALLVHGGVPAVAAFIGGAMLIGMGAIGLMGPHTRGVALEELAGAPPEH